MADAPKLKGASVLALASKPEKTVEDRTPSVEGVIYMDGDTIYIAIPAKATVEHLNATAKGNPFVKVNASGDYSVDVPVTGPEGDAITRLYGNRVSLNLFMGFRKPEPK